MNNPLLSYENHIQYLKDLGCTGLDHSGRNLLDHLQGVCEILVENDRSEEECLAGLYHSIYGTGAYTRSRALGVIRSDIRNMIGTRAETLVHIFCRSEENRTEKILDTDWFREPIRTKLRWIEYANLTEQHQHVPLNEVMLEKVDALKARIGL